MGIVIAQCKHVNTIYRNYPHPLCKKNKTANITRPRNSNVLRSVHFSYIIVEDPAEKVPYLYTKNQVYMNTYYLIK